MKPLPVNKRHPVIYLYIISVNVTGQIKRTCLIGDGPRSAVGFPVRCGSAADNIGFCYQCSVLIKPQMLIVQADFYVAACKIVFSVSLKSPDTVNRLSGNGCSCFQIFQKLFQLCLLINAEAILISGYGNVVSVGGAEGTGHINRIIICSQLLYPGFCRSLINADLFSFDFDPGTDRSRIQNLRCRAKGISNCGASVFFQLIVQ